ncbi:MAG: hypothetical protein JWQ19_2420 [Subtercola sp.]|nr:hypothetical protein [Subtercola sp.]
MANQHYVLPSGRALGMTALGDPSSRRLVVVCHPTPGAGGFDPDPLVTAASGLQLLMIDRPGYGASDPLPRDEDPAVERHADDVAEVLRHSARASTGATTADFDSVGVIGWGAGGGATALSLAARYPDLVDRLAVVATPRVDGPGLIDPVRRMLKLSRIEAFSPRSHLERVIRSHTDLSAESLGIDQAELSRAAPENKGVTGRFARMLVDASRQGATGLANDMLSFRDRSWAHDLPAITAQTLLVYGTVDVSTTARDGNWYRKRIADSRVVEVKGAGEFVYVSEWPRLLEHMSRPTT